MKKLMVIFAMVLLQFVLSSHDTFAHPGTGIVADKYGNIYFIYSKMGVIKISADSKGTVNGFAVGDFNEDRTPDIAAARSDAPNVLYFGNIKLKNRK